MDEEELKNKIFEIALTWRDAVEKLVKIEGKMPSNYLEDSMLALIASYSREARIKVLITNGGCSPIENVNHAHLEDVVWEDGHMVSAILVAENLKEGKPNE